MYCQIILWENYYDLIQSKSSKFEKPLYSLVKLSGVSKSTILSQSSPFSRSNIALTRICTTRILWFLSRALENYWKNSYFLGTPAILLQFCKEFETRQTRAANSYIHKSSFFLRQSRFVCFCPCFSVKSKSNWLLNS